MLSGFSSSGHGVGESGKIEASVLRNSFFFEPMWEWPGAHEHLDDIQSSLIALVMRVTVRDEIVIPWVEGKNLKSTKRKQTLWTNETKEMPFSIVEVTGSLRIALVCSTSIGQESSEVRKRLLEIERNAL